MSRTAGILKSLRAAMVNLDHVPQSLHAYIIPTGDAHQSEYVADCDNRRTFISGFTGSAGTAIITRQEAALWTDGRYYLQAQQQLDAEWKLMKDGLSDTPSQSKWLNQVLPVGGIVGCDPTLLSYERWKSLHKDLRSNGCQLIGITNNLVDLVWQDRPERPVNGLIILTNKEAGLSLGEKADKIREKMEENKASAAVFTALDEIAWLFNLRGSDILFNPVFFSYAIVTASKTHLFIDERKLTQKVKDHLSGVVLHPYEEIFTFMYSLADVENPSGKIWISDKSSFAICSTIPKEKRLLKQSSVAVLKAVKNEAEMKGMENAQLKDGVAMCQFLSWLEDVMKTGTVTEVEAADKAEFLRSQQKDFISLSFETISSSGPSGAIIHYKPTKENNRTVTTDQIYLIDSGAQYRDGTTDTTRTVHLGTPSKYEQECYTRVLKGHIGLSSTVFPNGVKGHMLDTIARASLWQAGLDYQHGTGHGVGCFLNVHEGPCGISFRVNLAEVPLEENMVVTDEPGYYEAGQFGIRIENCVKVVKADTKYNFGKKGFLTFEPITLVPIQMKMVDASLLTTEEIAWLNKYHAKVRMLVGEELKKQGKMDVHNWLMQATKPLG